MFLVNLPSVICVDGVARPWVLSVGVPGILSRAGPGMVSVTRPEDVSVRPPDAPPGSMPVRRVGGTGSKAQRLSTGSKTPCLHSSVAMVLPWKQMT